MNSYIFRKKKAQNHISDSEELFDRHLIKELLLSEQLRTTILIIIFSCVLVLFSSLSIIYSETFELRFHGKLPRIWIFTFFGGVVIYELIARKLIQRTITKGKIRAHFTRYAIALEEISLPTISIILMAQVVNPFDALLGPSSFVYFIFIILGVLGLDFTLSVFTGLVAAIEYYALSKYFIAHGDSFGVSSYELNSIHPKSYMLLVAGVIAGIVALEIKRRIRHSFHSVEERNKVVNIFGQHVSPVVVNKLLEQKEEKHSRIRMVCVMFIDIRNFTPFSEKNTPEDTVNYLNTLFAFMIDIVDHNNGIINKFLGDGFMAIFGAPISTDNPGLSAVTAGLKIIEKTEEYVLSKKISPTQIGIGLHLGEAITGNIGSLKRKEYTVIGDTVNLASRVEQLNKQFNSQLLITESVWKTIRKEFSDPITHKAVQVKGREQPVNIYQLA